MRFEGKQLPEYIFVDTPKDVTGILITTVRNNDFSRAKDIVKKYQILQYQNSKIILPYYEINVDIEKPESYLHLDFVQIQPLHSKNKNVQSDTYSDAFGITFEVY